MANETDQKNRMNIGNTLEWPKKPDNVSEEDWQEHIWYQMNDGVKAKKENKLITEMQDEEWEKYLLDVAKAEESVKRNTSEL